MKQAIEVAVDIINSADPDLPNLPLAATAGIPNLPPILIGDASGCSDNAFIEAVGDLAQGVLNRSFFDVGKPNTSSFVVNALYKKHAGHALDDTSARGVQGFLALMEAINQAGSRESAKIQAALRTRESEAGTTGHRL